jgi:hypothetical protein
MCEFYGARFESRGLNMDVFKKLKTAGLAASVVAVSASAAFAQGHSGRGWGWWWHFWYRRGGGATGNGGGATNAVPEIDAGAGLLAVAAVLATLTLAWELRRRSRSAR